MDHLLLKEKLDSKIISPQILLSNVKFLNERAKETAEFTDPNNLPFYYHMGKQLQVGEVLQIGVTGSSMYIAPCFLQSCKSVHNWFVMAEGLTGWQAGFVRSNIKSHMMNEGDAPILVGTLEDWEIKLRRFKWDMVIVSSMCVKDRFTKYLEYAWDNLKEEGLLVADYISESIPAPSPDLHGAFLKFCRVKNREPVIYETRHGVGILTR